uniref:Uncharacterized protein n=1 Tax=Oncorhynchus mykiss TaxID=8022 RepID=A0A8K9VEU7_ONCMY
MDIYTHATTNDWVKTLIASCLLKYLPGERTSPLSISIGRWKARHALKPRRPAFIYVVDRIQAKFPAWPKEHQLKGGISAYKARDKNVCTYEIMDMGTTGGDYFNESLPDLNGSKARVIEESGGDYSSDVVARSYFLPLSRTFPPYCRPLPPVFESAYGENISISFKLIAMTDVWLFSWT